MIKEPASKEWFKKHGSSKSKALKKSVDYEKPVAHKAVGGTMYFPHPKSKASMLHKKKHEEWESRKESYYKSIGMKK